MDEENLNSEEEQQTAAENNFAPADVPAPEPAEGTSAPQEAPAARPVPVQNSAGFYKPQPASFTDGRPTGAASAPRTETPPSHVYAPQTAAKKQKKKVSRVWIPVLLVFALLLGAGGGVLGYLYANRQVNPVSQSEEHGQIPAIKPEEDRKPISDDVRRNNDGSAAVPAEIYSENVNAVVGIASESTGRNVWGQTVTQASSGSGFIITEDGYVVTNYHVVENANSVTVQLYDGTEYPAQIIGYENTSCDVALLKIDATGLDTVAIGDSDEIRVGEEVCAIGNPLGELTFTLTVGYISALDRAINTDGNPIRMFQTDAAINSGNSGGPLFDMNGNVIGITTAKYSGSTSTGTTVEGIGFAIPINDVMDIIDDLTQYGYVTGKPYLGVMVGDSSRYGSNLPAGAYISEVTEGFAAQKGDLKAGDIIVGLGDSVVSSRDELSRALSAYSAGDTVKIIIYRDGQYLTKTLTLDERPKETEQPQEETEPATEDPFNFGGFGFEFP